MLAAARDIMIILLALETLIIGILMIVLIIQIRNLIRLFQTEIRPIFDSVNETAATVKTTTAFLSNNVASPVIRAVSFGAGAAQAIRTFRGGSDGEKRKRA